MSTSARGGGARETSRGGGGKQRSARACCDPVRCGGRHEEGVLHVARGKSQRGQDEREHRATVLCAELKRFLPKTARSPLDCLSRRFAA
eukprot:3822470-Prymnesium_polylepis.1